MITALRRITSVRAVDLRRDVERVTGIEPAPPAWKGSPGSTAVERMTVDLGLPTRFRVPLVPI
jgi:hypothetical protein